MYSKTISVAAAVLAASSLVSAQTFTDCNPLEKSTSLLLLLPLSPDGY